MQYNETNVRDIIPDDITRTATKSVDANAVIHVILRHFPNTSADEARCIALKIADRLGFKLVWM